MQGTDTATAILDAAERLFSTQGFAATSIREITRDAGVNVAAVHYHFGSKEALLRAVTDRIVGPLNRRRMELLDRVRAEPGPPSLTSALDAFIRPDIETLLELQARGATVAHFLAQTYSDRTPWIVEMTASQFRPVGERFLPTLAAALPHLDAGELAWRVQQVVASIVQTFADWPEQGMTADEAERLLARMVAFAAGGLSAPATGGDARQ